jgi:hypothetical protein
MIVADQRGLDKKGRDERVGWDSGQGGPSPARRDGRHPRITVLYTNIEGTLAAVEAAVHLARGLSAELVLLVAEELAPCYPLDHPPAAAGFFARVSCAILDELQLNESSVRLEIHFFRRRAQGFEAVLMPRSLVVLGMKDHGWQRKEKRLAHILNELGHEAILVESNARSCRGSRGDTQHARSVVERLLNQNFEPNLL